MWDDVEHTLLVCPLFRRPPAKAEMEQALGRKVAPEALGRLLCGYSEMADLANDRLRTNVQAEETALRNMLFTMINTILTEKEVDERSREVERRARKNRHSRGRRRRRAVKGVMMDQD